MLKEVLPKIKRKLSSFILDESGNIPKHSIVKIGTIVAASVVASGSVSATHLCSGSGGGVDVGGDGCCGDGGGGEGGTGGGGGDCCGI